MTFKTLIDQNSTDIAFIVGNGINRYPDNPESISWEDLLMRLWQQFSPDIYEGIPLGITSTEFYDLLELAAGDSLTPTGIQKEVAALLEKWTFRDHHKAFILKAHAIDAPVLTTNFDLNLPSVLPLRQLYTDTKKFTDYYPWNTYYSDREPATPSAGFGIWYINGFVKYHRSLRLGLSHYMGSVEKVRNFLHKGEGRLFAGKANWAGSATWLDIIFNKPLCIFGLGLEENEVFLRWLLIERAKYFRKFPDRQKKGWYISPKSENPNDRTMGKYRFFKGIGIELVEVDTYDDIYKKPWG